METTDQQINNINEKIVNIEKRLQVLEDKKNTFTQESEAEEKSKKKISINEFLLSLDIKDETDLTLAITFYLDKYEGIAEFNKNDLKVWFRKAKEKIPLNINDKVNMNIRKGYMTECGEKKDKLKCWYITSSGESYVEQLTKIDN